PLPHRPDPIAARIRFEGRSRILHTIVGYFAAIDTGTQPYVSSAGKSRFEVAFLRPVIAGSGSTLYRWGEAHERDLMALLAQNLEAEAIEGEDLADLR